MLEQTDTFLAVTNLLDAAVAALFLEMAGGDLETAVALFYEHGGAAAGLNTGSALPAVDDAAFAELLQREQYQQREEVREADRNAHFHDTLVEGFGPVGGGMGMFGGNRAFQSRAPRGVFNQIEQLDSDEEVLEEEEDDEEYEDAREDTRLPEQRESQRESQRDFQRDHRQRLADLFRPPFDIMLRITLDHARRLGQELQQWVLVNIQDALDFRCQVLNRDLWRDKRVKLLVQDKFVFLQYAADAPVAADYTRFYPFTDYPHIAILDPLTGERLKMWLEVALVQEWLEEAEEFVERYTIGGANPVVVHTKRVDPAALTEEQQMEMAMRQLMGEEVGGKDGVEEVGASADAPIDVDTDDDAAVPAEAAPVAVDEFAAIQAVNHEEPAPGPTTTRIQIRSGDGTRVVRRFAVDAPVRQVYEVVKAVFPAVAGGERFTLTAVRDNLWDRRDATIESAGLKNASVNLEVD